LRIADAPWYHVSGAAAWKDIQGPRTVRRAGSVAVASNHETAPFGPEQSRYQARPAPLSPRHVIGGFQTTLTEHWRLMRVKDPGADADAVEISSTARSVAPPSSDAAGQAAARATADAVVPPPGQMGPLARIHSSPRRPSALWKGASSRGRVERSTKRRSISGGVPGDHAHRAKTTGQRQTARLAVAPSSPSLQGPY
jgi:hypothetical protein